MVAGKRSYRSTLDLFRDILKRMILHSVPLIATGVDQQVADIEGYFLIEDVYAVVEERPIRAIGLGPPGDFYLFGIGFSGLATIDDGNPLLSGKGRAPGAIT